jgi:hypothetical protein
VITLPPIDASGRTEDGQPAMLFAPFLSRDPANSALPMAFRLAEGGPPVLTSTEENCPAPADELANTKAALFGLTKEMIERDRLKCSSRIIIRLDRIVAAHTRPFETVRKEVEASWMEEKQTEAVKKAADDVIAKVKAGATLTAAATAAKLIPSPQPIPINRIQGGQLDGRLVDQILKLKQGDTVALYPGDPRQPLIVHVDAVEQTDLTLAPRIAEYADQRTRESLGQDLQAAFDRGASQKVKVLTHEPEIRAYFCGIMTTDARLRDPNCAAYNQRNPVQ